VRNVPIDRTIEEINFGDILIVRSYRSIKGRPLLFISPSSNFIRSSDILPSLVRCTASWYEMNSDLFVNCSIFYKSS
jgi:hypothetical protein